MSRTNIEIDDDLIAQVMRRYGLPTKRQTVDVALRRPVIEPMTREEALAMEGSGWYGPEEAHDEVVELTVPDDLLPPDGAGPVTPPVRARSAATPPRRPRGPSAGRRGTPGTRR